MTYSIHHQQFFLFFFFLRYYVFKIPTRCTRGCTVSTFQSRKYSKIYHRVFFSLQFIQTVLSIVTLACLLATHPCHWGINIQMTCRYLVIRAFKCHQMLRNHHLQISNPASSGTSFFIKPFWPKSRKLIGHLETVKVSGGGDGGGTGV